MATNQFSIDNYRQIKNNYPGEYVLSLEISAGLQTWHCQERKIYLNRCEQIIDKDLWTVQIELMYSSVLEMEKYYIGGKYEVLPDDFRISWYNKNRKIFHLKNCSISWILGSYVTYLGNLERGNINEIAPDIVHKYRDKSLDRFRNLF